MVGEHAGLGVFDLLEGRTLGPLENLGLLGSRPPKGLGLIGSRPLEVPCVHELKRCHDLLLAELRHEERAWGA